MYKKLLSFSKRSARREEGKDVLNYTQIPKECGEDLEPECCCCCCCCNSNSSSDNTCCPPTLCPLCTASLVLPSCVGAIRALQYCSFSTTGVEGKEEASSKPAKNCCTWIPAGDSMTAQRLHVMANTRRCCFC